MPISCKPPISLDNLLVTPSAQKRASFRTVQQQYGDGYTARRQDGINPVNYVWDVSTPPMPVDDVFALEQEIIDNGMGFFSWTPPHESTPSNYVLDPISWDWSFIGQDMASLSFSLRIWNGS